LYDTVLLATPDLGQRQRSRRREVPTCGAADTWEGELERGKRLPEVSRHSIVTRGSPDTSGKVHIAAAIMRDGEFCSDCHGGRSRLSYRTVDLVVQ
jgi:hypothetical protein